MAYVDNSSSLSVAWWKSSVSGVQSDCVECGVVDAQVIAVRDSKFLAGPALLVSRQALVGLVRGVKTGAMWKSTIPYAD